MVVGDIQMQDVKKILSKNIHELVDVMGWKQVRLAEKTQFAEATVSKYMNSEDKTIPSLEFLITLCKLPDFRDKGIKLTLDLLMDQKFNPKALVRRRENLPVVVRQEVQHADFLGTYLCYFYDQSKTDYNQDHKSKRKLRYGVVSIFDDCENLLGDVVIKARATFFKDEERAEAFELKKKLDSIFKSDMSAGRRNASIEEAFLADNISDYEGKVTFTPHHTFINVQSQACEDHALIILYSPQKNLDSDYIGGIGSVASIARGRAHMPTAQKIIMSKYELGCSDEEISESLASFATITIRIS